MQFLFICGYAMAWNFLESDTWFDNPGKEFVKKNIFKSNESLNQDTNTDRSRRTFMTNAYADAFESNQNQNEGSTFSSSKDAETSKMSTFDKFFELNENGFYE